MNLQELQEELEKGIGLIENVLDEVDFVSEESKGLFIDSFRNLVVQTVTTTCAYQQTLAYIIAEHFEGEYLMSSYDVNSEFDGWNFFLGLVTNDDGSLEITAHREKQA